jgi:hypothetical protein
MSFDDFKNTITQRYVKAYEFTEFEGVYCCMVIVSRIETFINYSSPSNTWVVVCNRNGVRHEGKGSTLDDALSSLRPTKVMFIDEKIEIIRNLLP